MPLVDYSSEDSDSVQTPIQTESTKSNPNPIKPAFQKVVDRSNPYKIRINLPEPSEAEEPDEPGLPTKRAKIGSGGLGGFNALLPAPKRAAATNGGRLASGVKRAGLGSGVNLKTGAAPGFSREPVPRADTAGEDDEETVQGRETQAAEVDQDTIQRVPLSEEVLSFSKPVEDPKPTGKTTMFKPLSVARKPQKKKTTPKDSTGGIKTQSDEHVQEPNPTPKVSLFSTGETYNTSNPESTSPKTYQPMFYSTNNPTTAPPPEETSYPQDFSTSTSTTTTTNNPNPQSLTTIATDLHLTASQKRQLLGRHPHQPPITIINFNTDAEYAANEILRQAGETIQHNPVRAIAPGKHSLKQLVNAASNQKDALEESFASGRRNKKEAGSKYGW
ncbi:hypothetical protein N7G274_001274 [Stereocaulon virgatum]|uniref:Proline-rich protein PRCC n=1 Tax=Stereocaulon virgatum TaxID=373712 RepID=A0ABR4ANE8_9LECA